MHQFVTFDTQQVKERIACLVYNDPVYCNKYEQMKCGVLDQSGQDYEQCMIQYNLKIEKNATKFCDIHYQNFEIFKDNMGPTKL